MNVFHTPANADAIDAHGAPLTAEHMKECRVRWAPFTLLAVLGLACCGQKPNALSVDGWRSVRQPPTAMIDPGLNPAAAGAARSQSRPVVDGRPTFADCVVHAGDSRKTTLTNKLPGGELISGEGSTACSMNAECIQVHGLQTPGDGIAALSCEGRTCTCTLEPLDPPAKPTTFRVEIDSPCSSPDRAKELLGEHCLHGMKTAPSRTIVPGAAALMPQAGRLASELNDVVATSTRIVLGRE
jgi:hypothetical protein